MDSMTEFLARMRMHRQVFEDWGMTRVASTGRGITALFQGPPGTGKTMVAGALARELGIELYRVDLSRVMSKWIGETERNLGNVFSAAEESQAIILFDEADSLFGKRTEVKSSNDRFANLEVNYLLQRLDSFFGIAILTTNLGTSIDPAFKRRLAFRVHFPIPDEEQREQLWRAHLPSTLPTAGDLDLEILAKKYPLTGGSVRNCVMRAAFLAAAENEKLSQDHLMRAVRLEYRAAGKLSESGPLE
jgi:SpoVK/Ycf46/Vps4 family AAA+-type ATPase